MKTIEFFLYEGADSLDITGPLEVFTVATEIFKDKGINDQGYRVCFSAENAGPVKLASGMLTYAEKPVSQSITKEVDNLIVPGGLAVDVDRVCENQQLIELIQQRALKSNRIISVCTGAFILARCGLLDKKSCTTHWMQIDQLAQQYPDTKVKTDSIYVEDGQTYTSAGITAGIDLALALVEKDYGASLALQISRIMVLYLRRPGGQSQFSAPLELRNIAGEKFSSLHDWILENINRPLPIEDVAEQASMSPRNFSRLFKKYTGYTPGKYIELLRLSKARELLESTRQSVDIVAMHSGFQREERLRRVFIRSLGVTPSQYRLHFNA